MTGEEFGAEVRIRLRVALQCFSMDAADQFLSLAQTVIEGLTALVEEYEEVLDEHDDPS